MELNNKQREFILLRADGLSFDKIATQLKVGKATLIQWNKLLEDKIKEIQFEAFIKIKEAYNYSKVRRYEMLLKQLDKIDNAILENDLSKDSLKDLVQVKNSLLMQLDNIEDKTTTKAHIETTNEFGYKTELKAKLNEIE